MFKIHRTFELSTGVKNNSIAVLRDGAEISVIYHDTVVFSLSNGVVTLNNGGWDTVSTRIVINRALEQIGMVDTYLLRKKGVTYLLLDGSPIPFSGKAFLNRKTFKAVSA